MQTTTARIVKWQTAKPKGFPLAPFPMCFTESAFHKLLSTVGSYPPETGAKGFSPFAVLGFETIEFDKIGSARANHNVYRPDTEWGSQRQQFHLNQEEPNLRLWSGDTHSHPGSFGNPSPKSGKGLGDLGYVEEVFAMNELMEWFLLPIITISDTGNVVVHPWIIRRGHNGEPLTVHTAKLRICDTKDFPQREFNSEWESRVQTSETLEPQVASMPLIEHADVRDSYVSRLEGIVSPSFHEKTIAAVGVGAGSYMVEKLARTFPRRIKLCDPDQVEIANLCRTAYRFADAKLGTRKVDALARHLNEINPFIQVERFPFRLNELTARERRDFFEGVDLLIAGTDDFSCQALCNELAVLLAIPALFIGIHEGAQGGRIIWYLPDVTPCYRCVAKERFTAAEQNSKEVNLAAARGSLLDCQFIDTIAAKVGVALLERGQESVYGRFFERMERRNDIVCRCSPDYVWGNSLWDALLADLPTTPKDFARELKEDAFFAMDSIWFRGEFNPNCPVCCKKS